MVASASLRPVCQDEQVLQPDKAGADVRRVEVLHQLPHHLHLGILHVNLPAALLFHVQSEHAPEDW